ncbi:Delta(9)-fatty-acid desaturase fat-7 [Halotydeus destructor]|nr:Delta(9)-fatty-acid desaturase fat-7 [Halotydeus destructor]
MVFIKVSVNKHSYYYYMNHGDMGIVWTNVAVFVVAHLMGAWAMLNVLDRAKYATMFWTLGVTYMAGYGITLGAHRMWAHKSFEAKLPMRIFAMLCQTIAGQNCIYTWARDHRVHHKWSDTDGDPHNINRGYFFTHCGWLMRKKHPELIVKAKTLDYSDLLADPVVNFQKEHYNAMYFVFALGLPVAGPVVLWAESWATSFLLAYVVRYLVTLHLTWFVNSAAHMWGDRPYNREMAPVENVWVTFATWGEGYHNYHHQFPNDYRASESGHGFNLTRHVIEWSASWGQAFNLKTASDGVVNAAKLRNMGSAVVNEGKALTSSFNG